MTGSKKKNHTNLYRTKEKQARAGKSYNLNYNKIILLKIALFCVQINVRIAKLNRAPRCHCRTIFVSVFVMSAGTSIRERTYFYNRRRTNRSNCISNSIQIPIRCIQEELNPIFPKYD